MLVAERALRIGRSGRWSRLSAPIDELQRLAQVGFSRVIAGRRARARALDTAMDELDARLHRIGQHPFRAKFRLRGRDRAVVDLRGITTVRRHAEELVEHRLAPAQPRNDGHQTPYRGHPVFVAQHATATCCRTCLARWHGIPTGHALDDADRGYVVEAICRWIAGQYAPHRPPP
jgi:hypothetical protein